MKAVAKKQYNFWPVFIKSPSSDISSYALNGMVLCSLNSIKNNFQVEQINEISNYTYCPFTKIYLTHKSYNTGDETHFFSFNGNIVGSIVIKIPDDQLSNWRSVILKAKIIDFLTKALVPLEIEKSINPFLFKDNYSLKSGFSIHLQNEEDQFGLISVNVFLDLSQEVGSILSRF